MLTFTCPTCAKSYDSQVNGTGIVYMSGNKRVYIKNESDDCLLCLEEIRASIKAKREEIKAKKIQI